MEWKFHKFRYESGIKNKLMKKIITIQGLKNSGKDVTALMLQYLLNTPKFMHNYKFYKWCASLYFYGNKKYHIVSYAHKMKEILSILLNVDISVFYDRDFKENCYIDFSNLKLYHFGEIEDKSKILNDVDFNKEVKRLDKRLTKNYYLSIRQIMQFYGTQIMRHYFGEDIWILNTLNTSLNKIIVSDQRFINENKIAAENGAITFHIVRDSCEPGLHPSEKEIIDLQNNLKYDYLIENNKDLKSLFNKLKKYRKLIK